ncbi:MAG: short-chain dehydrogenase [Acidobacteria bacterium]|nr:MAG: short-chain dehydrogenase [Acidobacteriota bacterium]
MKPNTNQRVALITGANRGIGLQTAKDLGSDGVILLLGVRDLAKGEAVAAGMRQEAFKAEAVHLDVTDPGTYGEAYDFINRSFKRLDILINNAGVCLESFASPGQPSTLSLGTLRKTFETNFFGTVALTQKLLPLIRRSPAGRIVNVSSIMGSLALHADRSSPIYHSSVFAYNTSKAALNSFTLHLAYELRDTSIKVNSAHPGWVKTEMGGENADLNVSESGKTSAWLARLPEDGPTGGYFHAGQSLPW